MRFRYKPLFSAAAEAVRELIMRSRECSMLIPACFMTCLLVLVGCDQVLSTSRRQGLPAAWQTQLSLAQQAAAKIDSNAVLYNITAYPADFKNIVAWQYTDTLVVIFDFAGASDSRITVRMEDTEPTTTLKVTHDNNADAPPAVQDNSQRYKDGLGTVTIGPREAAQQTLQDASTEASKRRKSLAPVIGLDLHRRPASWVIQYVSSDMGVDADLPGPLGRELRYVVNAATGAIEERDYAPWYP
jgi:hypothetical protein